MTIERLKTPSAGKLNALTDLWEASVRATHDFLAPEDIAFFRQMVRQEALRGVELYVIRKPDSKAPETGTSAGQENRHESRTSGKTGESRRPEGLDENGMFGGFAAFAGIDGDMLEMLFVAPKARGKGVGRQLVEYLVRERGIRQVDVNEQNAQAADIQSEAEGLRPALTVLDELNVALACGMVTRENAERLIDAALAFGDVVSTGRNAPEWLREKADYVSEIIARKHPFQTEKLAAREGIEY